MDDLFFLPSWPLTAGDLLWYGALLLAGEITGIAFHRWLRAPRLLGWVVVGLAVGPSVTGALDEKTLASLSSVLNVAIGMVLFEVGQRVDLSWLRRNPWLLGTSVLESGISFAAMFFILRLLDTPPLVAAIAAALGVTTAPAVVLALVRDLRAQGQVTERMLLFTALNSIYTFITVSILLASLAREYRGDWTSILGHPAYLVFGSLLFAALFASMTLTLLRLLGHRQESQFICVIAMVAVAVWGATALKLSVALALLGYGTMMRTFDTERHFVSLNFGRVGRIFLILLFVLTAASLDLRLLPAGVLGGVALAFARFAGKSLGVFALARSSGLTKQKAWYLSVGLLPKAGVTMIIVNDVNALYPQFGPALATIVVSAVVILELIGPPLASYALQRSGETFEEGKPDLG